MFFSLVMPVRLCLTDLLIIRACTTLYKIEILFILHIKGISQTAHINQQTQPKWQRFTSPSTQPKTASNPHRETKHRSALSVASQQSPTPNTSMKSKHTKTKHWLEPSPNKNSTRVSQRQT
jgi:hypothetical protein